MADPASVVTVEHVHQHFDGALPPAISVDQGEPFVLHTVSLPTGEDQGPPRVVDELLVPLTGPVSVRGLRPGDVIKIDVLGITIADRGAMVTMPGYGAFGQSLRAAYHVVPIRLGHVLFEGSVQLPIRPMVGKLGVGLLEGPPPSSTVGIHGGNMDNKELTAGSSLLVPVSVDGASVFAGDLHARQGDGEVCLSAVEVAGAVTLRCQKATLASVDSPLVTTSETVASLGAGRTLESALESALRSMLRLVQATRGWSYERSAMFLSIAADVGICQVVNPMVGVKVTMPREFFPKSYFD